MDYLHGGLRTFFDNNDKKLRAFRRYYCAKFDVYPNRTIDYIHTNTNTWMDCDKNPWTT